jgi:subtilase family serine protease
MTEVELGLAPRHAAELRRLLASVTSPASPNYRHFLAPGAFRRTFGPTDASIATLRAYLRSEGITATRISPAGLTLEVRGRVRNIERAFATDLGRFDDHGRQATVNDRPMTLPAPLAAEVTGVLGLDGSTGAVDHLRRFDEGTGRSLLGTEATPHLAGAPAPTSSCSTAISTAYRSGSAGYSADEIAAAYGFDPLYATGDLGAGKSIAIIEFSGFSSSDISTYAACYRITPNVTPVLVDGGPTASPLANEEEAELDIEDIVGLAPGASVLVYEGTTSTSSSSDATSYDVYAAAVNDDRAQVISTSWGTCEAATTTAAMKMENVLFEQAALQGQSIVAAAGDDGSEDCDGTLNETAGGSLAVDDPASQPLVTGVGGTTLTLAPTRQETVWNSDSASTISGAGGGGLSAVWKAPAYQTNAPTALGVAAAARSSSCALRGGCRAVPDLVANAGAPYAIYCSLGPSYCNRGGWTGVGGTSAAAPTVASLLVLADASPSCSTIGSIGFANPDLYGIAAGTATSTALFDVTSGENDFTGAHGGSYPAGAGFDLASGLGSPIGGSGTDSGLVTQLCSPVVHQAFDGGSGVPKPTVTLVAPSTVRDPGSVRVTIEGTAFTGATAVEVGSSLLPPSQFTVVSSTKIVATVLGTPGRVHITVTTRAGASTSGRSDIFTVLVPPAVDRLVPKTGPSGPGQRVVIIGAGFDGVRSVTFGGISAPSFTVRSPTRIVAIAPRGSGSVHVVVVTRAGRSPRSSADLYRYR